MVWDREKQTYYILRRGDPWSVRTANGRYVCDFPAFCYSDITEKICFAADDDEVKRLVEEISQNPS